MLLRFLFRLFRGRLLKRLYGNDVHFDHFGIEVLVNFDLFVVFEDRLIDLLGENFDLRVAKFHHGGLEVFLWHIGRRLDVRACDLTDTILVEEAKDAGLVDADREEVSPFSE